MATTKQTKEVYAKLMRHFWGLQTALNHAHRIGLIEYKEYDSEAPCKAMYDLRKRIRDSTEKALAGAMHDEIVKTIKDAF